MTLTEVINEILTVAKRQPLVHEAGEGDIYDRLNGSKRVDYSVVWLTQGSHYSREGWMTYRFTVFYVDRLLNDLGANRLEIQSTGIKALRNIVLTVCDDLGVDEPDLTFTPFTQRFRDETAGVYTSIDITLPIGDCHEDY